MLRTALGAVVALAVAGLVLPSLAIADQIDLVQPPQVSVSIAPEFREKALETYGLTEIERLADGLRDEVARELARTGVMAGGRVELVLTDAKPNRPTPKELGDRPGLSFRSFSLGGAAIKGQMITFDGKVMPVTFSWYASDITDARRQAVWGDAHWTFDRFAHRLSRGQLYALR
ncbi:MAG: hypothetical protein Q7S93_16800 [Phenylobacterium sp.]|uniref:hypothetical protein n=1 Tax=Phenylobacterium sp. TaxID=1871053 RepID=UPI00271F3D4E|nr:hypothetical protein [Phenylobacterium sp.]MDO8411714.1 hypothetical protein [Phenylobacterium sp.]